MVRCTVRGIEVKEHCGRCSEHRHEGGIFDQVEDMRERVFPKNALSAFPKVYGDGKKHT